VRARELSSKPLSAAPKSGKKLEDFSIEVAGKKPRAGSRKAVKQ
jgi:hypothetical protein